MRGVIFKVAGVILLIASLGVSWLVWDYRAFLQTPLPVGEDGAVYVVEPGSSLRRIAGDLADRNLLSRPRYLVWLGRVRGQAAQIQAGEYRFEPGITPPALLDKVVAGRVTQYALTIVEGWTSDDLLTAVRNHPQLQWTLEGLSDEQIMVRLDAEPQHPEGWFLPDTYHFPRDTTDVTFLRRAHQAMVERLNHEWEQRAPDLPYNHPEQALVLASIVEKETSRPDERHKIAGVFVRRLQQGMRLQSDPTTIYGLGEAFDGNLTRSHLRHHNPYNTYRRDGLPPTPIALPGAEALHAALHPADGDSLYFVSRGDGSHYFSATLEEHNEAVRRFQLNQKEP